MLATTLRAEVDRINGQLAALSRKRFAALARCDAAGASRLADEQRALYKRLHDLTDGQSQFKLANE